MHLFWGVLMMAVGLFLIVCASLKSELIVYRLLVARSRLLWKEKVYVFHQVSGALVMLFGLLVALKVI